MFSGSTEETLLENVSSEAIWEARCLLFDYWDSIFAPREDLGRPFWHLGSTLGCYFGVSEAPWEAILAPRDHPGGPWEQQEGHEVANNRIFVDFGLISDLVSFSFWNSKCVKNLLILGLFLGHFFISF